MIIIDFVDILVLRTTSALWICVRYTWYVGTAYLRYTVGGQIERLIFDYVGVKTKH